MPMLLACGAAPCAAFLLAAMAPIYETLPASKTGVAFIHDNAISTRRYLPESMGPGVAIFDYDNDGWMDLYFTNSGPSDFFTPPHPLSNALYHNNHDGTFTDATKAAGLDAPGLHTAAVWFDYDQNGTQDVFVGHFVKYSKSLERDCRTDGVPIIATR